MFLGSPFNKPSAADIKPLSVFGHFILIWLFIEADHLHFLYRNQDGDLPYPYLSLTPLENSFLHVKDAEESIQYYYEGG